MVLVALSRKGKQRDAWLAGAAAGAAIASKATGVGLLPALALALVWSRGRISPRRTHPASPAPSWPRSPSPSPSTRRPAPAASSPCSPSARAR
ncbi:MAG: hypothetical protein M0D55_13160 [Elusimicrobiota bacterium]|nr:MAG: hypothetical protein M0D55_13160 [Elusimicrobiota bacterium]